MQCFFATLYLTLYWFTSFGFLLFLRSCLTFGPGSSHPLALACSERLQDIFDVIRADCSAADAASLFFLPFVRIAITMKWQSPEIISAVTIYRISTLLRLEIHRCLDHFCKVPFNNFINCIYMFWSNVGARFRKCINNAIFYLPASIYYLE